jgi:adenylate cyclase
MSIRLKTLAVLAVALVALILGLHLILAYLIGAGFVAVETRDAQRNMSRVREVFASETDSLCQQVSDWAAWDDAYAFAGDRNERFVKANIASSAFEGMKLDFILLFDQSGATIASQGYVPDTRVMAPVPPALMARHFAPGSKLIKHLTPASQAAGLLLTDGLPPALACSRPILTSNSEGPVRGAVIFGRFLRERERRQIEQSTRLAITLAPDGPEALPAGFPAEAQAGADEAAAHLVRENAERLAGYVRISDVYGHGSLIVRARLEREIYKQARLTSRYVVIALSLMGLVTVTIVLWIADRLVLRRLLGLSQAVLDITQTFDMAARVPAAGRDEISRLGQALNGLLAAGEQLLYTSEENEAKQMALWHKLPVALAVLERATSVGGAPELIVREASAPFTRLIGVTPGQSLRQSPTLAPASVTAWQLAASDAPAGGDVRHCELVFPASDARARVALTGLDERRVLAQVSLEGGTSSGHTTA